MNRRSLYSGMKVAFVARKHSNPVRAIITRVDRSEGYGASHTVVLCDETWQKATDTAGNPITRNATSRQIKDWNEVEEGVEEAQFLATKRQIEADLDKRRREKEHEPWEQFGNTLALLTGESGPGITVQQYGGSQYRIIINKSAWDSFLGLLLPMLTQRLFEKSFGSAINEPGDSA